MAALEDRSTPEHRQKIANTLNVKQEELAAHEKSKPAEVPKPENDPVKQREIAEVATAVEAAKRELAECERQILEATQEQARLVQLIAVADRLLERVENLQRQLRTFSSESQDDFASIGVKEETVLKVTLDKHLCKN